MSSPNAFVGDPVLDSRTEQPIEIHGKFGAALASDRTF